MNYIKHLNSFFSLVKNDNRLSSTHVSLYLAMFHYWNFNRFQNPFSVYRENLMQISKIGSKNTYHRCVKDLHQAKYIFYHPGGSRFQTVRISIVRLCTDEEGDSRYSQQVLFPESLPPPVRRTPESFGGAALEKGRLGTKNDTDCVPKSVHIGTKNGISDLSSSTENDTDTVPKMIPTSTKIDTDTVPKMGHSININYSKLNSVCNTRTKIFEKNEEKGEGANPPLEGVPRRGGGGRPEDLKEVETFFLQHSSTTEEAHKFFYYNQGKNWMLTDKLPITDWKAVAHKWLLNINTQNHQPMDLNTTIQAVYQLYLEGQRVNKLIQPEFADHLQLQISDAIKHEAIHRRINQLSGSNENGHVQLWKAYMQEEYTSDLVKNDEANLLALAKRLAVAKHFQKLKSKGQQNVFSP